MQIKFYGHSCFLLTAENGTRVLTDPCDETTGYKLRDIEADVVTVSHDHFDHNYTAAVAGDPVILRTPGEHEAAGIRFTALPTWHDKEQGAQRGSNLIFVFEMDGLKLVHLGDLGHIPDAATCAALENADVMFAPIGGTFTIDCKEALALRALVKPKVMIPMHYATPELSFPLDSLQQLIDDAECGRIHRLRESEAVLTRDSIGNNRILALDYVK